MYALCHNGLTGAEAFTLDRDGAMKMVCLRVELVSTAVGIGPDFVEVHVRLVYESRPPAPADDARLRPWRWLDH